jgi:ABC-2 type transport system permease protein
MVSRNALYVAGRAFRELRRDIRTMVLFVIAPTFVLLVVSGLLQDHPQIFNRVGLIVMGLFPCVATFLFSAFMMHRERYRGTLEYLLTTPTHRLDVLVGYMIAFTIPAVVQVGISHTVTYYLLGIHVAGAWWAIGLLSMMNAVLGVTMGLFVTNLARNEFQLVLTLPVTGALNLLLSGVFLPHEEMIGWMRVVSNFLPWRYAVGALAEFEEHVSATPVLWYNVAFVAGIIFLLSAIATNTVFSRRSA